MVGGRRLQERLVGDPGFPLSPRLEQQRPEVQLDLGMAWVEALRPLQRADPFVSAPRPMVGIGDRGAQTPVIVVEPVRGRFPHGRRVRSFKKELRNWAIKNERTACIEHILFERSFPVDVRHNAKIDREQLGLWAARRIR